MTHDASSSINTDLTWPLDGRLSLLLVSLNTSLSIRTLDQIP